MSGHVIWKRGEWDKLVRDAEAMKDMNVCVGIQGPKASEKHEDSNYTNAQIGAVHEFSTPSDSPPGRPWLRPIYDSKPDYWKNRLKEVVHNVIKGANAVAELRHIGEDYRREVVARIKSGIAPQLALSTLMRRNAENKWFKEGKKSGYQKLAEKEAASGKAQVDATPLWDTGAMVGAISVEIKRK